MKSSYELMHKNILVASCEIEDGRVVKVGNVSCKDHAPVGTYDKFGMSKKLLDQWFRRRAIPVSRDNIKEILERLKIQSPEEMLEKAYGLSLSDQYWIRPLGSKLKWEQINFFQNAFSEDLGSLLLGNNQEGGSAGFSLMSPDVTLDGWLRKKWKLIDGKRCLVKAGSGINRQEPLNERIASELCERLGIKHIHYDLEFGRTGEPYSICEDYITPETELVTAYAVCTLFKQPNHESDCAFYVRICQELGIKDASARFDEMLCVDYLMANTDRHWTNFGVVRHADNLEFLKMMPIFDTGSSLWHQTPDYAIGKEPVYGKMLRIPLEQHLRYVKDPSFLEFSKLKDFAGRIREIFALSQAMAESRSAIICDEFQRRVKEMDRYLAAKRPMVEVKAAEKIIAAGRDTVTVESK